MTNRKVNYNRNYKGQNAYPGTNRAYAQDRARSANVTDDYKKWKRNPSRWDFEGIDTPKNVFYYKGKTKKGHLRYKYKYRKNNWKKFKK